MIEGGGEGEPIVRTVKREGGRGYCSHQRFDLRTHDREVRCHDCGERVEPFDAMVTIAREWESAKLWGERVREEEQEARVKLEEAKRELRSVRAQVARAKRKAAGL